jgi:SAM-dependent methyltransferase
MTGESSGRAAAAISADEERHRLRERLVDHITIRHLDEIGVGTCWRCLDVAAGSGSIAAWLAGRVGPGGVVAATELDTRFLSRLSLPNLTVRRHDISRENLEPGSFDLVHCRGLLMHLTDPRAALARMAAALKPGGWFLVEEVDFSSVAAADPAYPAAEQFNRLSRALAEAWRTARIMDPYFGRQVRSLVEALQLTDVRNEGITWVARGGEDAARYMQMTISLVPEALLAAGITPTHVDYLRRLYQDPGFCFTDVTLFSAWGRKRP